MMQSLGWLGTTLVFGCAVACGQDLALPTGHGPQHEGGQGPLHGLTGIGGVPTAAAPGKLPVIDHPRYTTFGGAPADEGEDDPPSGAGRAGKASGGAKGQGGSGGSASSAAGEGGGAGLGVEAPPAQLLFTEYLEGTGSLKALEMVAVEKGSLEGCELLTYFNGKAEPSRLALHGALEKGDVVVLCSTKLAEVEPTLCTRVTSLTFNGDDALALACHDLLQDIIGEIGVDPGTSWGLGATLDHVLRRRCSIKTGRSDPSTPFMIDTEWELLAPDALSDLGQRACE